MVRIRRIGVLKAALISAAMVFVVSLIFFVPIWLLLIAAGTAADGGETGAALLGAGLIGGLVFGFVIAVVYAIFAFIGTAIAVAIYNLVAGAMGGIELQLEALAPAPPPPPTQWSSWSAAGPPGGSSGAAGGPPVG